jgi:class 3 adenylate cyclase
MGNEPAAGTVRFAEFSGGREVAYRVLSQTPGPLIVHAVQGDLAMELLEEDPFYDRFLRALGQAGTLVLFDKPGLGASDPFDPDRDYFEQCADAYLAVLDALDARAAWLYSSSMLAAVLASTHRERIRGAVMLTNPGPASWSFLDRVDERGPVKSAVPSRLGDPAYEEWIRRARRAAGSLMGHRAYQESMLASAARWAENLEPLDGAPPVMIVRRRDAPNVEDLEWWQRIFPDAETVTIEGADIGVAALDAGLVGELMAGFITGKPVPTVAERPLMAVLFTDIVDSTPTAATSGDAVWRSTLDRYEAAVVRTVERHHGTVVKHTGDGALATFPSGSEAIAAAVELRNVTKDLGLEGRTGLHVGEVEQRGEDIGGIAVHLAARVMGRATPGEILATLTVAHTSLGGRHRFVERGEHELKGTDQPWELLAVEPHEY